MNKVDPSKVLFSISKTDVEIVVASERKAEIEKRRQGVQQQIERLKKDIDDTQTKHQQLKSRQEVEEERLRGEEKKIVERRKQLTALGGTKGAKLVEREIDIAARTLQTMEQRVLQALEEVDGLAKKIEQFKKDLEEQQLALEATAAEDEASVGQINERLSGLIARRDEALGTLDEKIRTLYQRVRVRYPGGAIAKAEGGSCRACFRSLPPQMFNLVLSGDLHQCPGCSRILVTVDTQSEETAGTTS